MAPRTKILLHDKTILLGLQKVKLFFFNIKKIIIKKYKSSKVCKTSRYTFLLFRRILKIQLFVFKKDTSYDQVNIKPYLKKNIYIYKESAKFKCFSFQNKIYTI